MSGYVPPHRRRADAHGNGDGSADSTQGPTRRVHQDNHPGRWTQSYHPTATQHTAKPQQAPEKVEDFPTLGAAVAIAKSKNRFGETTKSVRDSQLLTPTPKTPPATQGEQAPAAPVDNANPTPAPAPAPFNAWAKKLQVEAQRDPINLIEPKPKSLWDRPTETVNAKDEGHDVDEGLVEEFEGDESGAGVIRAF